MQISRRQLDKLLYKLSYLGAGSQGSCYVDKSNGLVYKVFHTYTEKENSMYTMGDIARYSINNENLLYKLFGVNAELIIDHAWGFEPTTIKDVKNYKPENNSISTGQVLHTPYDYNKTKLIIKEMIDSLSLCQT